MDKKNLPTNVKIDNKPSSLKKQKQFRKKLLSRLTPAEIKTIDYLRDNANIRFRSQYLIFPYIADFYFPSKALVVELDGSVHNSHRAVIHDNKKESYFASIGMFTEHLENKDWYKIKELLVIYPDIIKEKRDKIEKCISVLNDKLSKRIVKIIEPTDINEMFDIMKKIGRTGQYKFKKEDILR